MGGKERFEFREDQPRVAVNGPADREEGNASIVDPEVGEVGAREVRGLEAFRVRNTTKREVPYYLDLDVSKGGREVELGGHTRRAKGEKG